MIVGYSNDDLEWKFTQVFCNFVLRWGVEREVKMREEIMAEVRAYRYKRAKQLMLDEAYRK